MGINVLSLFDGISCGQLALKNLGIEVDNYFACEIDKHAIAITQKNFPNTIQLGDVKKLNTILLPKIDLMFGGFPCQSYSLAGKQAGFNDPRGLLFFDLLRIKQEVKPKYFLFENVKMKKEIKKSIDDYLSVEGILINSALFSAQNRERYYWTNLSIKPLNDPSKLRIRDILEDGVEVRDLSNYFYTPKLVQGKYIITLGGLLSPNETLRGESFRNNQRVISIDGKHPTLLSSRSFAYLFTQEGYRKPTVIELERLQGLPDNYTDVVCKTQRQKAIGNGWQVDTIQHILKDFNIS